MVDTDRQDGGQSGAAAAAFLATLPLLPPASWPLRVGLGGAVGDLQWRWLEPAIGNRWFALASLAAALLLGGSALGVRWAEGIWAAGKLAAGSLWVGRRLGDAAGAATIGSGRLVRDGWRGLELGRRRRPGMLAPATEDEVDPAVRRARRRLVIEPNGETGVPQLRARRPREMEAAAEP